MTGRPAGRGDADLLRRLFEAALVDHRAGRLDAAKAKYADVLRHDPKQADALHLSGQIAFTQGEAASAVDFVNRAIALDRRNVRYVDTLALMLNRLGRSAEAEAAARRALSLSRSDADAYVNLATALQAQDRLGDAEAAFERALALSPNHPVALVNLGAVILKAGRFDEAEQHFRRALEIEPNNAVAWANLAEALHELERMEESEHAARRALALDPNHAPAHASLGLLHLEAGEVAAATTALERAHALRPGEIKYLGNLANAYIAAGNGAAALAAYDRFLAAAPGDPQAIYNKGICQMLLGDLEPGLENFEQRWNVPKPDSVRRQSDKPEWGPRSPTDVRLFVWSEQGVGDHLFNAAFLPALVRLGVSVVYECDPRLVALLSRSLPEIQVVAAGKEAPPHDFQVPAGSMLRILRTRGCDVAPQRAWLKADPVRVAEFRARLAEMGPEPKVGISWRSARKLVGPRKSMPLAQWTPILATPGVRFVNLQYGDTEAEIAEASARTKAHVYTDSSLDRFDDIDGLAALIQNLDLVLTTSNVTAHIAGALGCDTVVALQRVPLWYWGMDGERSPYYPAIRLLRQVKVGDWKSVADRLATLVQKRIGVRT